MTGVALIAAVFIAYALLAGRLDRAWISAPIVFVVAGLLLGPSVLGLVDPHGERETLLRVTDRSVTEVCMDVGLQSLGSFTTSFKRMYGKTPTAYRAAYPPAAAYARVPMCVVHAYTRPQHRTFREDSSATPA